MISGRERPQKSREDDRRLHKGDLVLALLPVSPPGSSLSPDAGAGNTPTSNETTVLVPTANSNFKDAIEVEMD